MQEMDSIDYDLMQRLYKENVVDYYTSFEPVLKKEQAIAVYAGLNGKDVLATLPTSFGKFLCIVAPTLIKSRIQGLFRIHIIISPLVALCVEQAEGLRKRGLKAVHVGGEEWNTSAQELLRESASQVIHLIVSPEMLRKTEVREKLEKTRILCISVDEGHCVTEWGTSFRKDYAAICDVRSWFPAPMGVYTATLTHSDKAEVISKTGLRKDTMIEISKSPDRKEIFLALRVREGDNKSLNFLVDDINNKGLASEKTLVFVNTISELNDVLFYLRDKCNNFARHIHADGTFSYMVEMFSGCTNDRTKTRIISDFCAPGSIIRVLIATVAFGMGLNVHKLTRVIIYKMPDTVSILWQEVGRSGRGGEACECMIFIPKNPVEHGLASALRNTCVRRAILRNFTGFVDNEATLVCNCSFTFCTCTSCICCTFCRSSCKCRVVQP